MKLKNTGISSYQPRIYIFEGADGSGKTTLAEGLFGYFKKKTSKVSLFSFPGAMKGTLGKLIYDIHHEPSKLGIDSLNMTSLQTLHVAAHIDTIENAIIPAFRSGNIIILDRYWWSTWVYGVVLGANRHSLQKMIEAELIHWGSITPTVVFLISRPSPLGRVVDPLLWGKLTDEYEKLARRESRRYNIQMIKNENSLIESIKQVIQTVESY